MEISQSAQIRRLQDTLSIVGMGVIAFGAWTLAKMILFFFMYSEERLRETYEITNDMPMVVFFIAFGIIAAIDLAIRIFVGMSARAEGYGKRKGVAYLVFAVLLVASSISSVVMILMGSSSSPSVFDTLITFVIELTSAVTMIQMIVCAVRLRRLSKLSE